MTTVSVKTQAEVLAANYAELSDYGLKKVFSRVPRALQDAMLPALVVWPGPMTRSQNGSGMSNRSRIFRPILYVFSAGLGTEEQGENLVYPWFDLVADHFEARPGLSLAANEDRAEVITLDHVFQGDQGYVQAPFPLNTENSYHAIIFQHTLDTVHRIVYRD